MLLMVTRFCSQALSSTQVAFREALRLDPDNEMARTG